MSIKKAEIKKSFIEILDKQLLSSGFLKEKNNEWLEYKKNTDFGFNRITPVINQYSNLFFVSLGFSIRIDVISDILSTISNISDEHKLDYPTISYGFNYLISSPESRIQIESKEELDEALNLFNEILEKEAIAIFGKFQSVESFDKEINREDLPKNSVFYGVSIQPFLGITSAVLNKNPKTKYWESYYREKLINANQHLKNQYEKLVIYLNGILPVKPLEHYDTPYDFLKSELSNNSEIKNFTKFNGDGLFIPIKIGFGVNMFDNVSKQEYINYVNCYSKQSVSWEYEGQKIILADKNVSIKAYPSLDLKYVVAIYEGLDGEYKPPSNAVIYNADGSIQTILKMAVLESENILKKINFNKDSNPPIEASSFEGGLLFSNFDWWQNEEGDLINRIQIIYDRDWIEWRELDIKNGKVGKYIGQGKF